jgi:CubicO group peptidase (beta-lactamase class C family)
MTLPIYQMPATDRRAAMEALLPQISEMLRAFAEQRRTPGLSWGFVLDDELIATGAMGIQNVATKTPVTPDSVFRIASMTKSFTAMGIVHLRDAGRLQLDTPVAEYVPEFAAFAAPTRDSAPITVRDLLTMNAGFPQDDPWADRQLAISEADLSALIGQGMPFSNPPGLTFEYSNYGYAILGRVVANVSGERYQDYIEKHILDPLGMTSTTFDINTVPPERLALGHRLQDGEWLQETPLTDGAFASIGGLFTTIPDFTRYMAFLLSAHPPRDDEDNGPVRRSSLREMQRFWRHISVYSTRPNPAQPAIVETVGYGYGLMCAVDAITGQTVSHGGGLPGYGTFYRLLPQAGVGMVAFTNLTYGAVYSKVIEILQMMQKAGAFPIRTLAPAPVLNSVRDQIVALYEQWDDARAAALCTDTFFMDLSAERRAAQFGKVRADLGRCLAVSEVEPENWLRGRWLLACERGTLEIFASLAPTVPPRVQYLTLTPAVEPDARLRTRWQKLLRLLDRWNDAAFRVLFAPTVRRNTVHDQFAALRAQFGQIQATNLIESDGIGFARVLLMGERGKFELRFALDPKTGKVREVSYSLPRGVNFVP